jgi:di/tricarboxylate transporter
MTRSLPKLAASVAIVALILIVIAQYVHWRADGRLNPRLVLLFGLMIVLLTTLNRRH